MTRPLHTIFSLMFDESQFPKVWQGNSKGKELLKDFGVWQMNFFMKSFKMSPTFNVWADTLFAINAIFFHYGAWGIFKAKVEVGMGVHRREYK